MNDRFLNLLIVLNLAWLVNVYLFNIYAVSRMSNWETIIWNVIKALIAHACIMSLFVFTIEDSFYSQTFFYLFYAILIITIFLWRTIFVILIRNHRIGGYNNRNVILVGANQASFKIYNYFLSKKSHGYKLKAVFGDNPDPDKGDETFFYPEQKLYEYLAREKIDEIYCALPLTSVVSIRNIMSYSENNLIRFRYVPDFRALLYKKVDIEFYGMVPVLSIRTEPLEHPEKRFNKRLFDIGFSGLVILLLFPVIFLIIALLIKLTSSGPVLFKQIRSGRNNKIFLCYKFRTMTVNSCSDSLQATKKDARITPIGKFLRKSSIDELPQFFNVLFGDMSVVGPRPHMVNQTEEYKRSIDKFMVRHFVKPGITGWAQVNGLRGVTDTPQKMIKRARYDMWYIENYSLILDIKIIVMTVLNIFKGDKNAF